MIKEAITKGNGSSQVLNVTKDRHKRIYSSKNKNKKDMTGSSNTLYFYYGLFFLLMPFISSPLKTVFCMEEDVCYFFQPFDAPVSPPVTIILEKLHIPKYHTIGTLAII